MGEPMCTTDKKADLLLKNALVITMDEHNRILPNATVAIADGRILAVETTRAGAWQAEQVIDCAGDLLFPGFVDCLGEAGRADSTATVGPLAAWEIAAHTLPQKSAAWWRQEGRREAECALFFGITTLHRMMPCFVAAACADAYQQGAAEAGLSLLLSCGPDNTADDKIFQVQTAQTMTMLAVPGRRLYVKRPATAAQAVYPQRLLPETFPADFVRRTAQLAALLRVAAPATPLTAQFCGGELAAYTQALPQLAARPALLYGLYGATHAEIALLQTAKHSYAHSPQPPLQSTLFLEMLFAGVPCGISPGNLSSRIPQDMLLAGRRAMLEEITQKDDYHYLPAGKVLALLTRDAAQTLGLGADRGAIAPGKRADLNLLCWHKAHLTPRFMPVQAMVQRGYGQDIRLVIAGGHIVKQADCAGCGKG